VSDILNNLEKKSFLEAFLNANITLWSGISSWICGDIHWGWTEVETKSSSSSMVWE